MFKSFISVLVIGFAIQISVSKASIIGDDDRVVVDVKANPQPGVGLFLGAIRGHITSFCTAALISEDTILTPGHCIADVFNEFTSLKEAEKKNPPKEELKPEDIHFEFQGGLVNGKSAYGSAVVGLDFAIPTSQLSPAIDFVILKLNDKLKDSSGKAVPFTSLSSLGAVDVKAKGAKLSLYSIGVNTKDNTLQLVVHKDCSLKDSRTDTLTLSKSNPLKPKEATVEVKQAIDIGGSDCDFSGPGDGAIAFLDNGGKTEVVGMMISGAANQDKEEKIAQYDFSKFDANLMYSAKNILELRKLVGKGN